jgi:hypothetical protein
MRTLFVVFVSVFLFTGWKNHPDDFMVGTWKSYKLETTSKKHTLSDSTKSNFSSEIVFYKDSTYKKMTNGVVTTGRYEKDINHIYFFSLDKNKKWVQDWVIRWPVGEKDPVSYTKELDIVYPELVLLQDKKGKMIKGEVSVYYIKKK